MKTLTLLALIMCLSISAYTQPLEQRLSVAKPNYYRYVPLGAVAGTAGTIIGNAVAGKPGGIAGGSLFSIASSLLVRHRTDAVTSLHTVGAGFACTAGLTIGLNGRRNKRKPSVDCFKF